MSKKATALKIGKWTGRKWDKKGVWHFNIPQFLADGQVNPEWLEFRAYGIGASEISSVLNSNSYTSALTIYYRKIGLFPSEFAGNAYTFWGRMNEKNIADIWQYSDGTELGYIENYNNGNKLRKSTNTQGFLVHEDYPHLPISPDQTIAAGQVSPFTGEIIEDRSPNEIKTASFFSASSFVHGMPPQYYAQVQQQMLVMDSDYGEFTLLVGGNQLLVFPVYNNPIDDEVFEGRTYREVLIEQAAVFWQKVTLAKQGIKLLEKEGLSPEKLRDAQLAIAAKFEPAADQTEDYTKFKRALLAKPEHEDVVVDRPGLMDKAHEYKMWDILIKKAKEQQTLCKNQLIEEMAGADIVELPGGGKVTHRLADGKKPYWRLKVGKENEADLLNKVEKIANYAKNEA